MTRAIWNAIGYGLAVLAYKLLILVGCELEPIIYIADGAGHPVRTTSGHLCVFLEEKPAQEFRTKIRLETGDRSIDMKKAIIVK